MNPQFKTLLKISAVVLLAAAALGFFLHRGRILFKNGDQTATVWFYDQSEKRLYSVPATTQPPHKGIGGKSGDGVRAIVVSFPAGPNAPRQRRIAYLETYTPELKDLLDRVQAAHAAGKPFAGLLPGRSSDFFQTNTLVKRQEEAHWHPLNSPEGHQVTSEWRSWKGPQGQAPAICVP